LTSWPPKSRPAWRNKGSRSSSSFPLSTALEVRRGWRNEAIALHERAAADDGQPWNFPAKLTSQGARAGASVFTAHLLDRRSSLLTDQIEGLREATRRDRERHPFHIDAFFVLPDHIDVAAGLFPQDWAGELATLGEFGKVQVAQSSDCALRNGAVSRCKCMNQFVSQGD
jgi:hypothetical protein